MVNLSNNLQYHKDIYSRAGFAVIPNFLEHHYAEFIETECKAIPVESWAYLIGDYNHYVSYKGSVNTEESFYRKGRALYEYKTGKLTHSYKRHDVFSDFKYTSFLLSSEFRDTVLNITGEPRLLTNKQGIFNHGEDDFIARHHYTLHGTVGYIFNITSGWELDYGGIFTLQDIYTKEVVLLEPGTFNSLIVFDVDRIQQLYRAFSRVNVNTEIGVRMYAEGTFTKINS